MKYNLKGVRIMLMFKKLFNVKFLLVIIIVIASFLRLYKITVNPPSLFGDELDLGYQAYSILKTGRDYQGNFMPIHFHSLAEWRTPLYLYSAVPTVAVWGISPLGVRLPAVIFGVLGIWMLFLLVKEIGKSDSLAVLSAALLAISPWHLQYSRAGFEATQMLFFLLLGLWLFFKSLKNAKWLWLSVICLIATAWVYSTAKLFTPVLMVFLFVLYRKEIFSMPRRFLVYAVVAGLIAGVPIAASTLVGGGAQRFNYISVFSDPTTESQVGFARQTDARVRGETGAGLNPRIDDKLIHNKITYWGNSIIKNYLEAYSTDFLFIKGDPNLRQSIGIGEFYRIEIVALVLGAAFFFFGKSDKKTKIFMVFWIIFAPVPSAITVDGGNHATRLILLLPPFIYLIAVGWVSLLGGIAAKWKVFAGALIVGLYVISFALYLHEYYVHYPWESERWWHYGWGPAISEVKLIDSNYDRVIISMSGEPAWIFFAGYYEYPPSLWQKEFPLTNIADVPGFGRISHTGKFYFAAPSSDVQIYGLGRYIDSKTLYLANASEVGANLITTPDKTPQGLKLIEAIPFPSGEPAFYLFSGVSTK